MIVEFIGAPGAGKTTLLPAAAAFFRAHGLIPYATVEAARPFATRTLIGQAVQTLTPVPWRGPLLWQLFYHLSRLHRLRYFLRQRRLVWMVYRYQQGRPISERDRRHVLRWFFHHVGYQAFLQTHLRANEVLLFDEGLVHRVVQHYASECEAPDLSHMRTYLDLLPRPDLVIAPVTRLDACRRRVYQRGVWPRFQQKRPEEVARYLANAHAVVSAAVQHLKQHEWPVVEVDNNGPDPGAAADELTARLSRLFAPWPAPILAPQEVGTA